jgi:hypothetical protein
MGVTLTMWMSDTWINATRTCCEAGGRGTWQNRAHGAACPQLAKADMRAFGRHSGFDPTRTMAANFAAMHTFQTMW